MRVGIVGCVVLALVLTGCLGSGDDLEDESQNGGDGGYDGPTGILSGKVLTVDLDPVTSATVSVSDGEQILVSTEVGTNGEYRLGNVPTGTWRAQVTATCCSSAVAQVQILENQETPQDFQLEPFGEIELRTPWNSGIQEWRGFIACNTLGAHTCGSLDPSHAWRHSEEVDRGVKTITVGVDWEPAAGFGAQELQLEVVNEPDVIASQTGTDTFEITIDDSVIEKDNLKFNNYEDSGWVVLFRVQPPELQPDIVYQQEFTLFWTFHYWEPAPSGYSTLPDL